MIERAYINRRKRKISGSLVELLQASLMIDLLMGKIGLDLKEMRNTGRDIARQI